MFILNKSLRVCTSFKMLISGKRSFSNKEVLEKSVDFAFRFIQRVPQNPRFLLQNWAIAMYVRHVLKQDFLLSTFLEACPFAVGKIVDILHKNQNEDLKSLMNERCYENIVMRWARLNVPQKRSMQNNPTSIFLHPQLTLVKPSQTESILRIKLEMYQHFDLDIWENCIQQTKDDKMSNYPFDNEIYKYLLKSMSINHLILERDVSVGIDSSWKFVSMQNWPLPFPALKHL